MEKATRTVLAAILPLLLTACASPPRIATSITLGDGSVIRGELTGKASISGDAEFKRGLDFPLSMVGSFAADGEGQPMLLTFSNGDKLHIRPRDESLQVASALGELEIPIEKIGRATFSPIHGDGKDGVLLFHCTFDSPEAVAHPAVGPGGKVFTDGAFEPGHIGNAMRVGPRREAARFEIPAGFLKPKGCIEWWARIQSQGDGFTSCDPRFFRIRFNETVDSVFEFSSNDGMGGGGLVIRFPGICHVQKRHHRTAWKYSQYFGEEQANGWHHYAFVWNAEGLPARTAEGETPRCIAVFIDGKEISTEPLDLRQRISLSALENLSATIDFPFHGELDNPLIGSAEYLIDEMKIWDVDAPPGF